MQKILSVFTKAIAILLVIVLLIVIVFIIGRYGWKIRGFDACGSAAIESVEVSEGEVRIKGYSPGFFAKGFLGYHAEEKDGKLYIGFKFSDLFGIFETGTVDVTVKTTGEINEVVMKTANDERVIWSELTE